MNAMLYVFCGSNTNAVRERAFLLVHEQEEEGARVVRIDADSYAPGLFADLVGAVSLFGGTEVYLLDMLSQRDEVYEDVLAHLSAFAESAHTFIVIEGALLAPEKKKFEKHAVRLIELKAEAGERFNAFGLADALASKDKKQLWMLLQDAKRAGLSEEELIGTLWWQLKALRLAALTKTAEEAGMKDWPYQKAKRSLTNFKPGEVETLSRSLLTVYHDGHGGVRDLDLALESWVLSV